MDPPPVKRLCMSPYALPTDTEPTRRPALRPVQGRVAARECHHHCTVPLETAGVHWGEKDGFSVAGV